MLLTFRRQIVQSKFYDSDGIKELNKYVLKIPKIPQIPRNTEMFMKI